MNMAPNTSRSVKEFWKTLKDAIVASTAWTVPPYCVTQKQSPVQARPSVLQDDETSRISRYSAHESGKVFSPTHRTPPPQGNIPSTHFCYRLCRAQGHSAAGRIRSVKHYNDPISNRTRELPPACSAVPKPTTHADGWIYMKITVTRRNINPLRPELNSICYLLALLAHHFLPVSRIRVKSLTFRRLMSYIYGAPILDVSRSHTTTQHSR